MGPEAASILAGAVVKAAVYFASILAIGMVLDGVVREW